MFCCEGNQLYFRYFEKGEIFERLIDFITIISDNLKNEIFSAKIIDDIKTGSSMGEESLKECVLLEKILEEERKVQ